MKHIKILGREEGPDTASYPTLGEKVDDFICKLMAGTKCP